MKLSDLTKEEKELILKRRQDPVRAESRIRQQQKILKTSIDYWKWLVENGRGSSFSTFIEEFGYDGHDSSIMYKAVVIYLVLVDDFLNIETIREVVNHFVDLDVPSLDD